MPSHGGVSVALPIFRADPTALREAFASLRRQTLRDLDILLVLNGADPALARLAGEFARKDPRARLIELPRPNLAAALNTALKHAHFDLVGRMDADDTCEPTRLQRQAAFMAASPRTAALGTAWVIRDESGGFIGIEHPSTDPARIRWRLLLGNLFCHGSMMLRRDAALAAGGYDESLRYAQDYDLWLRLAAADHDLANLPDILYHYSAAMSRRHYEQATAASAAMLRAWSSLPPLPPPPDPARDQVAALTSRAPWGGAESRAALSTLELLLDRTGPTREGLLAWQWVAARAHGRDTEKRAALRTAGQRLRAAGARQVWLYGAGRHTAWLLDNADELGLPIAGIIDDALAGAERRGHTVASPADLPDTAHLLISSDAYEQRLWEASFSLRARGVRVWRIYRNGRSPAPARPPPMDLEPGPLPKNEPPMVVVSPRLRQHRRSPAPQASPTSTG